MIGNKKTVPALAPVKACTGCMACADACHRKALQMLVQTDGHWYPVVDSNACIGCGACERACPIQNHLAYSENRGKSTPLAAWTTDKEMISRSASGGIFAAIASYVLSIGGYVSGAVSTGKEVKHIVINDIKDLPLLQGTKYLQSNTSGVYQQVKKLLIAGNTVLFSGTGCQVGGLLQFLGKKYDNLYTIDLICAGVPSSLVMTRYCEEELSAPPVRIRWRDKEKGWQHGLQLTITTEKEQIKPKTSSCFFGGGFLGGMTSRWSCYNCQFAGSDRLSDFTIGDYWGVPERLKAQWHDGVSVLIVHSEKGKELLEKCKIATHPTSWQECVRCNPRILLGYRPLHKVHLERRLLAWNFQHLPYAALKKIYAGYIERKEILWLPYKVIKFIRWKMTQNIINRRVKNILKKL